jgi:FAD/FMN-containing dehydrogenase
MSQLLKDILAIVGKTGLLLDEDVKNRNPDFWGQYDNLAKAIVRPATTQELSKVMALCYAANQSIVPWGGITGLVHGALPSANDIALSLERMNTIGAIDDVSGTITVEAGCVLQNVQEAAVEKNWLFALDIGARGSATIGGNIATNAGGNQVLRYGMMRQQVLGLEAVLADGTVVSSMNTMLKNNAGYDLKQLFIGSEGTLGIVTKAVLRLNPLPKSKQTALLAVTSFDQLTALLKTLNTDLGGQLTCFEVMWDNFYQLMVDESKKHQKVFDTNYPYYILVEAQGADPQRDTELFENTLGHIIEQGGISDAIIAQSVAQAEKLWAMRDDIETLVGHLSPIFAFDISLPIHQMEAYLIDVECLIKVLWPQSRLVIFGHLGDGNLHLGISVGDGSNETRLAVEEVVYQRLAQSHGSISAEHGIGLEKKDFLHYSRSNVEINLMKTLKKALDPKGLLNPGKVI